MTTREILIAAKAKIADPAHWTQRANARDASGCPISAHDDNACRWCADGALSNVALYENYMAAWGKLGNAAKILFGQNVVIVNDDHDHAAVMKMFDKAIELAGVEIGG